MVADISKPPVEPIRRELRDARVAGRDTLKKGFTAYRGQEAADWSILTVGRRRCNLDALFSTYDLEVSYRLTEASVCHLLVCGWLPTLPS